MHTILFIYTKKVSYTPFDFNGNSFRTSDPCVDFKTVDILITAVPLPLPEDGGLPPFRTVMRNGNVYYGNNNISLFKTGESVKN